MTYKDGHSCVQAKVASYQNVVAPLLTYHELFGAHGEFSPRDVSSHNDSLKLAELTL
jgi:hypothetical protein